LDGGQGVFGAASTIQPRFALNLQLSDPTDPTEKLKVVLTGVKFENWAVRVPQDTFVMENVTFKAIGITVTDTDESTEINVAFPELGT